MSMRIRPHVCALLTAAFLAPATAAVSADGDSLIRTAPAAEKAVRDSSKPKLEAEPGSVKRHNMKPARSKAADAIPEAASEVDTDVMKQTVGKPELSEATRKTMKLMLPDLQVEIKNPTSASQPIELKIHNKGTKATPVGFTVVTTLVGACEAGKLTSPLSTPNGEESVEPIPAGSFRYVFIQPSSTTWGNGGCYIRVKAHADSWGIVAESNENNNVAHSQFCPGTGSCY